MPECQRMRSFWYGAPYDYLARLWAAQVVNQALNLTQAPEDMVRSG